MMSRYPENDGAQNVGFGLRVAAWWGFGSRALLRKYWRWRRPGARAHPTHASGAGVCAFVLA
jgi:hypothetical protein